MYFHSPSSMLSTRFQALPRLSSPAQMLALQLSAPHKSRSPASLVLILLALMLCVLPGVSGAPRPTNSFAPELSPASPCLSGARPSPLFSPPAPRCDRGFYCPHLNVSDSSTWPTRCAPTIFCTNRLASGVGCDPQGYYDPSLCASGYYCPEYWLQIECPEGSFCPAGASSPHTCPPLSLCVAGSEGPLFFGGIVAALIVDLAFWIVVKLYRRHNQLKQRACEVRAQASSRARSKGLMGSASAAVELCEGFDRARKGAPIKELTFALKNIRLIKPANSGQNQGKAAQQSWLRSILDQARALQFQAQKLFRIAFPDMSAARPSTAAAQSTSTADAPLVLLNSVSATFNSGSVTAVLGGSGAGKSTLFNCIMGNIDPSWQLTGSLSINGDSVVSEEHSADPAHAQRPSSGSSQRVLNSLVRPLIGFVPQTDLCHRELTVHDNILYSAMVRLPSDWTRAEKLRHAETVIRALGIEHIAHQVVGDEFDRGVSGGERKRVSIGMELAAAPLALLLDEPTSGLDPSSSLALCALLKEIASTANIAIGMIVHQPRFEIFSSLDQVLLLARGGHTVYFGPQSGVRLYFESSLTVQFPSNTNPADIIIDAIDKSGPQFADIWKRRESEKNIHTAPSASAAAFALAHKAKEEKTASLGALVSTAAPTKEIEMETIRVAVAPKNPAPAGADLDQEAGASAEHSVSVVGSSSGSAVPISSLNPSEVRGLRGAPFWQQVLLSHERGVKQVLANPTSIFFECLICFLVSAILSGPGSTFYGIWRDEYSALSPTPDDGLNETALYFVFALSSAASTPGVFIFAGPEMPVYWREASAGHSPLAYFLGKVSASIYRWIMAALHMGSLIAFLGQLQFPYGPIVLAFILTMWVIYGMCSIAAHLFRPMNAPLTVIIGCVLMSTANGILRGVYPEGIKRLFFPYWLAELWTSFAVDPHRDVYNISSGKLNVEDRYGYDTNRQAIDYLLLFIFGLVYHAVGYQLMTRTNKEKQGNFS